MRNRRSVLGKRCSLPSDSRSSFCRRRHCRLCGLYVRRIKKADINLDGRELVPGNFGLPIGLLGRG